MKPPKIIYIQKDSVKDKTYSLKPQYDDDIKYIRMDIMKKNNIKKTK